MIDKDLAARLKSYRNFKHLTQKDVAAYLKVPHSAISDIENGKKYDYYNIANIARLLTELPDEDLKEVMFMIEYKRKRNEEKNRSEKF